MKLLKLFYLLLIISFFAISCDKQDNWIDVAKSGAKNGVGFGSTLNDALPVNALPDAGTVTKSISVFVTGETSGSGKTVTLTVDTSVLSEYNLANGTEYPEAPSEYVTLPTSITIPANSKSGSAEGSFDITGMSTQGTSFALGLRLSSASDYVLVGQEKLVIIFTIQNQYDADYTVKGYFVHPSSPRAIAVTKHIYTISAIRCEAEHSDLYTSGYYFDFDVDETNHLVNYAAAGSTPVEPASGFMTEDNPAGVSTYPGAPYTSDVYNNTYDPNGKIFWMHYGYGGGSTSQSGYTRQVYEKWTLK